MKSQKIKWPVLTLIIACLAFTMASCSQQANKENPEAETTSADSEVTSGVQTVSGEVLDLSCFLDHGASGQSHKKCAQGCLNKGLPAGIMAKDGKVYLLIEDHDISDAYKEAIQHAAENVAVTGEVTNNNGLLSLKVQKVETDG